MLHKTRVTVGLAVAIATGGCFFDFDRGIELEPGDVSGRAVTDDGSPVPYAKVVPTGVGQVHRTAASGGFLLRGLSAGGYSVHLSEDSDGDGWPERVGNRSFAITVQAHADGLFGAAEPVASFVLLDDVELGPVVEVNGTVTLLGAPQPGAKVFVWAKRALPAADLGNGAQQTAVTVDAEAEAEAAADAAGRFRFKALASGELTFVAFWRDRATGEEHSSTPVTIDAPPGATVSVGDLLLTLDTTSPPPPAAPVRRDVQLELSPPPTGTVTVVLERADVPEAERNEQHRYEDSFDASPGIVIRPPLGAWRVSVSDSANRSVFTSVHLAPPGDELVLWRLHLDERDPCDLDDDGERDCDGDTLRGLPVIDDWSDPAVASTWAPCASSCAGLVGEDLARATCSADGETWDCDDDGDGQPDVTEHYACYGLFLGGDLDADGLCDHEDPYPQCAANDPADPSCAYDDDGAFVPPSARPELGGGADAGPQPDAGPVDAGPTDAGPDAGPTDAGPVQSIDVVPLYPNNGANWNTHVKNNGPDRFSADDTACDGTETGRYDDACVHGGEHRTAAVPGRSSCAGLSARDSRSWFTWTCDDTGGTVRFLSDGYHPGIGISATILVSQPSSFLPNSLEVFDGPALIARSTPAEWWTNDIIVDNNGMIAGEALDDTIYIVSTTTPGNAYIVDGDRVTFLIDPLIAVDGLVAWNNGASAPVDFIGGDFFWFEGAFADEYAYPWLSVANAVFPRVRGFGCTACQEGMQFNLVSTGAIVEESEPHCAWGGGRAFAAYPSTPADQEDFVFRNLRLRGCTLYVEGQRHLVHDVSAYDIHDSIDVFGYNNTLVDVVVNHSFSKGFDLSNWGGLVVAGAAAHAINAEGFTIFPGPGATTMTGTTAALADGAYGHWFRNANDLQVSDTLLVGNAYGLLLNPAEGVFDNVVAISNAEYGVEIAGFATFARFTGVLKVGSNGNFDCRVNTSGVDAGVGLVEPTCTDDGTDGSSTYTGHLSDAVLGTGHDGATVVVGQVLTDDSAHPGDDAGVFNSPDLSAEPPDAIGAFEHRFRTLGLDLPLGSANSSGSCFNGCRIWDFALRASDTTARNVNPVPSGDDTRVHRWYLAVAPTQQSDCDAFPGSVYNSQNSSCETVHMKHAWELVGDRVGNDNGLCESDERCMHVRNIGAYQGHGALIATPPYVEGVLTGVELFTYEFNGY